MAVKGLMLKSDDDVTVSQCPLSSRLPAFSQYIDHPTRGHSIPDKYYVNVRNAYKAGVIDI